MIAPLALLLLTAPPSALDDPRVEDVRYLYGEMRSRHPDLYFGTPREEFDAAFESLCDRAPDLTEDAFVVEVMRFVALLAREGRDGHSGLRPFGKFHLVPLRLYHFDDGWRVVQCRDDSLLGARVRSIGGVDIADVEASLRPLMTLDGEGGFTQRLAPHLLMPELHHVLGSAERRDRLTFGFDPLEGEPRDVELDRMPFREWLEWSGAPRGGIPPVEGALWLSRPSEAWWTHVVEDDRALYVQYNEVGYRHGDGSTVADLGAEIVRTFEERGLERVIVDVRLNGGGNNGTFPPFMTALRDCEAINQRGRLYLLTGRATFSAAGNFTTVFERDLNSILVGEATGGAPNQYGDAQSVKLPNHPDIVVRLSTRYHEYGGPDDERLTHEPHVAVPLTYADYAAGRDPVLRAALEHQAGR